VSVFDAPIPEPEWEDEHRCTPRDYCAGAIKTAAVLLRDAAAKAGNICDDGELCSLLDLLDDEIAAAVIHARVEFTALLVEPKSAA
jgi:hypothetical protein